TGARHTDLLRRVRDLAEGVIGPRAQETDQAEAPPVENIRLLADVGALGASVPTAYGGSGAPGEVLRSLTEILAGACGVTAFVVMQHLGACGQVAAGEDEALKARVLPHWATGERFCTLAFSHLRRPGPPVLRVELDGDGYVFNGSAPWATGWGLADDLLLAGTLPDGRSLWAVAPAIEDETLRASPPMRLCAATASGTVSLTCRNLRLGRDRVVKTMEREQLLRSSIGGMLSHSILSLGVAGAAAALVRARAETSAPEALLAAAEALERERDAAREAVEAWAERETAADYRENVLRLRAWCIDLGVRAAHAAVGASGGSANGLDHPAQRLFREAMLYTVTAQTPEIQAMTLERLTTRGVEGTASD
ncbi:MAG TPA: acyl-CoA dehydrogenase family protein, partial [Armatimonadota bacterium]|nr:acyl-CoA dehydrogenase family protein [Armatimonadota bacterium]